MSSRQRATKSQSLPKHKKKGDQTREHILDISRKSFNRKGISNVTCRTIAADADLNSAGNVYYYFANKEAILEELRIGLENDIEDFLFKTARLGYIKAENRKILAKDWFTLVWKWRFFFLDIHQVVRDDPEVKRHFFKLQQKTINLHTRLIEDYFIDFGMELTPEDQKFCHNTATSTWIISVHWLQYLNLGSFEEEVSEEELMNSLSEYSAFSRTIYDDDLMERIATAKKKTRRPK